MELAEYREESRTGKGIPEHTKMKGDDDVDRFLYTFQRHMDNFGVTERYWVSNLIPLLTDHLRSVYGELDEPRAMTLKQ